MKFPFTSIFFLGMLFFGMISLRCTTNSKAAYIAQAGVQPYSLQVERGAFHYDSFLLKGDTLHYIPREKSNHANTLYNNTTHRALDSSVVNRLIDKIEKDGFWELNMTYKSSTTCTSQLRVTLKTDKRSKTVTCDDFERDCPDLIKYIDQKVVELEGNRLVRIYLPG